MQNNRKITISVGKNRKSINWISNIINWSEFVEKLKIPHRTNETLEEYMKLSKTKQDDLKDVGGFVGGSIEGPRRLTNKVKGRDLITLDLDNIATGKTDDVLKSVAGLSCAYVIYSTRKHAEYAPRLRVIVPLDREVSSDEYEPIARKLASIIGIDKADPTTFEPARLMYWPSCSIDSDYIYEFGDKPFLNADGILGMYEDWKDISTWPQVPGHDIEQKRLLARQQNPTEKNGIIGAFCKTYNVLSAMERFIPNAYEETAQEDRFTYVGGSTSGGAIIYNDGDFLYSHHATDPCSGKLVNAFDLIRLHLFSDLDDEAKEGTPVAKMPSFIEMRKLAVGNNEVSKMLNEERHEKTLEVFKESVEDGLLEDEDNLEWMEKLLRNSNTGAIEKTINNVVTILEGSSLTKGKNALDEFANRGMVLGPLPWNSQEEKRLWTDVDDAELARYLETGFNITGQDKIDKGLTIVSSINKFNDVKVYLESLKWDGTKRIDTLLSDYLGAKQNVYTADIMKKSLAAAVRRAIEGPTKYDYMVILVGAQGIGKSTFLKRLGREWFSDSLQTFEGKEAAEMIQGTWINELGELTGMSRSETNAVKQFLSKEEDIYREAYGRRTGRFPRRCVFFGTTNNDEFLRDMTGNRRFWPVDVGIFKPRKSVFDDLEDEVDQIWAEAKMLWVLGEPLYLSGESEIISKEMQELHRESNVKEGTVRDFIERKVPKNWDSIPLGERRMYWAGNLDIGGIELVEREKVCSLEVWCECFNGDQKYMKQKDSIEINNIISSFDSWIRNKSKRRYGYCGIQRGFERNFMTKTNIRTDENNNLNDNEKLG
ncbi:MAG: virulence-associated protein E [Tissierellia bacterium]|nr:virulence-associated protein E [Tissierellia bacterium]